MRREVVLTTLLLAVLLLQEAQSSPVLFQWLDLSPTAFCCRRKMTYCCPNLNSYQPVEHVKRPWPLLTNEGLTPEEIQQRNVERRARRQRQKDRQRDKESRRPNT